MMDVGRLDAQEERGGAGGAAERQAQKARVAGARPKPSRGGQSGKGGDQPDPVAKLARRNTSNGLR